MCEKKTRASEQEGKSVPGNAGSKNGLPPEIKTTAKLFLK